MMQNNLTAVRLEDKYAQETALLENRYFSSAWSQDGRTDFFVCLDKDRVIGAAGALAVGDTAEILCVVTHQEHRRRGAARMTLTALMSYLSERGVRVFNLEVRASNPAIELYRSMGFETVGRRKNYYTSPTEDAVLMTKGMNTL